MALRVSLVGFVAASALTPPPPATLVLQGSDVGPAFSGQRAAVSNADAARGAAPGFAAMLARWGRVEGYEVDFTRRVGAGTLQDGPIVVKSSASAYRRPGGAHLAFLYATRHLVPTSFVPLRLGFGV